MERSCRGEMVEIREKLRARSDAKFFAMETLRMVLEWIKETNPQSYLPDIATKKGEEAIISVEEYRQRMRDWINKSGDLIEKSWELPVLLVEDAAKVLKEYSGLEEREEKKGEE